MMPRELEKKAVVVAQVAKMRNELESVPEGALRRKQKLE